MKFEAVKLQSCKTAKLQKNITAPGSQVAVLDIFR